MGSVAVRVSYVLSLDRNSLLQFPPAIKMTIPFECVRERDGERGVLSFPTHTGVCNTKRLLRIRIEIAA